MFIYDLYSICSELAVDDPNSLYKQLTKIKAPIFVAFGAQEPFILARRSTASTTWPATSSTRSCDA